jgi:hypothetical protein
VDKTGKSRIDCNRSGIFFCPGHIPGFHPNPMEEIMYLYWRIQQDLNCLGEFIQFHDPALRNAMYKWAKRNYSRMLIAESLHTQDTFQERHQTGPVTSSNQ